MKARRLLNRLAHVAGFCLALGAPTSQAALELTAVNHSTGAVVIAWNSLSATNAYTLQARDSLTDGLWLTVWAEHPWPIHATQWTERRIQAGPMNFYRVVAVPAAERGKILSTTLARTFSTLELGFVFAFGQIPVVPQYSVAVYKVVYETVDPLGGRTQASGALAVPVNPGRSLPLVSYQHGTLARTNDAPSNISKIASSDLEEIVIGLAFATTGYAAALPDYLGLGDSPPLHPYHHARSEATAGVDMLRAARSACAANGLALNGQLFLCGYSQGGHATMVLHRELEAYHTNEFTITASAPMAGAYDLSGVTMNDFLSDRAQPNPYYFAYLLAAYQEVYQLADSFAAMLTPPLNMTLPPLLRGNSDGGQINTAIRAVGDAKQIIAPEWLAAFRENPRHPLRLALRDNDCYDWTPRAPMRMFHCQGDQDVVFANSQTAYDRFQSRGATHVQLIDPLPSGDHGDCVLPSMLQAKTWFDALKQ